MAVLAVQNIAQAGLTPAYAAADVAGDSVPGNNGRVFLHLKNTNGANRTVTIDSVGNCSQGFDHNVAVIIPLTVGDKMIGPFDPNRFGSTLALTYDAVTGLTIAAVQLPAP